MVSPIVTRFFAGLIIVPRATTTLDTPAIVELPAINEIAIPFPPPLPTRPRGTSRTWQVVSPPTLARAQPPRREEGEEKRVPRPRPFEFRPIFLNDDEISIF